MQKPYHYGMWAPPSIEELTLNPPRIQKSTVCGSKIQILLSSPFYQAGDVLHGRLLLDLAPHTFIGNICIGLKGQEQIICPLLKTTDPFLHSFSTIQDALATPINNISGKRHYTYTGYRKAQPGKIVIPFSFSLPLDLPSSNLYKKVCSVNYEIVAICEILRFTDPKLLIKSIGVKIVERWDDFGNPFFSKPVGGSFSKQIVLTPGIVHLHAEIENRGMNSFSKNYVKISVRNSTTKKICGIKLQLLKKCTIPYLPGYVLPQDEFQSDTFDTTSPEELIKTRVMWSKKFSGQNCSFDPGEFRTEVLEFYCPEECYTGRLTSLFYISTVLRIKLIVGVLTKPLDIELPIIVRPFGAAFKPPGIAFEEQIHPLHYNHLYLSVKGKQKRNWLTNFIGENPSSLESSEAGDDAGQSLDMIDFDAARASQLPWGNDLGEDSIKSRHITPQYRLMKKLEAKFRKLKTVASREEIVQKPFIVFQNTKKENVYYGFQRSDLKLWEYRLTSNLPPLKLKRKILKGSSPAIINPRVYFNSEERCKRSFFAWYFGVCPIFDDSNKKDEEESAITTAQEYYGAGWWCSLNDNKAENVYPVIPSIVEPEQSLKTKSSWGDWLHESYESRAIKRETIPKEWKEP
eukprot:NODE_298_length_10484_cov_0.802600.p1 type:complete len:630 gc:universal NODE_298_length_10484_cov_0.802600:6844-8733(+)